MGVSELFYDAILSSGCLVQTCDICGKTHFATEYVELYENGELEELRKNMAQYPDRYVEHADADTIHNGMFAGRIIVYGCCEKELEKHEKFIWQNRYSIKKYIEARAKKELEDATTQASMLISQ